MDILDKIEEVRKTNDVVEHNVRVFNTNMKLKDMDTILMLLIEDMGDMHELVSILMRLGYNVLEKDIDDMMSSILTYNKCYIRIEYSLVLKNTLWILSVLVKTVEYGAYKDKIVKYSYKDFISKHIEYKEFNI